MGTFTVKLRVFAEGNGKKPVELDALVDSGAFYSWIPENILRKLRVEPIDTIQGELADGTVVTKKIGEVKIELQDKKVTTRVIFGNNETTPLVGAYTLEGLGFQIDPVRKKLVPIRTFPLK